VKKSSALSPMVVLFSVKWQSLRYGMSEGTGVPTACDVLPPSKEGREVVRSSGIREAQVGAPRRDSERGRCLHERQMSASFQQNKKKAR